MTATIAGFDASTEPDVMRAALARDGVVIVERLLSGDVVEQVDDAVAAADPVDLCARGELE